MDNQMQQPENDVKAQLRAKIQQNPGALDRILNSITDERVKEKIIQLFGQNEEMPNSSDIDQTPFSDDGIDYDMLASQVSDDPDLDSRAKLSTPPMESLDKWKRSAISSIANSINEEPAPAAPEAPPAPTKPSTKPSPKPQTPKPGKPNQPWKKPFNPTKPHTEPGPMNKRK